MKNKQLDLKWVQDLISNDYKNWSTGDAVVINTQTGTGKTQFIKDTLIPYAEKLNCKVLYIYNRKALGSQVYKDIPKSKNIDIISYQRMTEKLLDNKYNDKCNSKYYEYTYIIFDEFHYLMQDLAFNNKISFFFFEFLKERNTHAVNIFISATMDNVSNFINKVYKGNIKTYINKTDYSYVNASYFTKLDDLINTINNDISDNKWLVFANNITEGYNLSEKINNSEFICSTNNQTHKDKCNISELNSIIHDEKFTCKCLVTTKILDNGININDSKLTNIVILALNKVDFIQMLGRKRIDIKNPQKINLYISKRSKGTFTRIHHNYIKDLELIINEYHSNKKLFNRKYDTNINEIGKYFNMFYKNENGWKLLPLNFAYFINYKKYINKMIKKLDTDDNAFIKEQLNWINVRYHKKNHITNVNANSDVETLEDYLEYLYKNKTKLFKDEQIALKEFISKDFDKMIKKLFGRNDRALGIRIINQLIMSCGLDFILIKGNRKVINGKKQSCWEISKIN